MPGSLGKYQVGRTLGQGASCKVKLGQNTETGEKVAIKILNKNLDPDMQKLVMTEVEALRNLKGHSNIIQIYEEGVGVYENKGKQKEVPFIVLEIANGGELFDFIACSGAFDENVSRFYFKQFMDGLAFCHQQGFSHRDLKPENLMLGSDFVLKIADFGFAGPIQGRDGGGTLSTNLGTLNYMAPEIHLGQDYDPQSVDMFSAAIILFIMVSEHPPFSAAQPNDPFYRCLAANRSDIFWKTHLKEKKEDYYSDEFKDLVQNMLHLDPEQRYKMKDVLDSAWMNGPVPSKAEVDAEFEKRKKLKDEAVKADKDQKSSEIAKKTHQRAMRNAGAAGEEAKAVEDLNSKADLAPEKTLLEYEKVFAQNTEFFSTCNPDVIEEALVTKLKEEHVDYKANKEHYKVKFTIITKGQDGDSQETGCTFRILKVNDQINCVEFTKTKGTQANFHEAFGEYQKALDFANDTLYE